MSVFDDADKSELLRQVLARHGVTVRNRQGWQSISCPIKARHSHGDANKSCSANVSTGYINCHGCGFTGDGFGIMQEIEGMNAKEVTELFGSATQRPIQSSGNAFTFARRDSE